MNKKIISTIIILELCIAVFAGCGSNNASIDEVTGDQNAVVATMNGFEMTTDAYKYFIIQNAIEEIQVTNPDFDGDFTKIDWNSKTDSGETVAEAIKSRALGDYADYVAMVKLGEEKGVKVTDEDMKDIMASMEQYKTDNGEEEFKIALRAMGFSSADGYEKVARLNVGYQKVEEDFNQNRKKYIDDEEVLQNFKSSGEVCAQHILIKNDSEKHSNPEAVIKEVLEKAKAGEDFEKLMSQYNEDPGQPPAGYSFGKGVMVPEFETAAFSLEYNEISDVVETDYGHHILRRVVGISELKTSLRGEIDIYAEVYDNLSVEDIMTDVYNAGEILNKKQTGGK